MLFSGIILLIVYGPIMALIIRDTIVRCRALAADLRSGYIKQFAGTMPPDSGTDKTLVKLREARIVPKAASGPWSLELLPVSRRVWRVQEQRVKPWIVANVTEVAQTPEMAAIAAQWLQPTTREGEKSLLSGQRELSDAERDELQKYARRLWMRPFPAAIVLTLWAGLLISHNVNHYAKVADRGGILLIVILAFCVDLVLLGAVGLAQKLRQDAQGDMCLLWVGNISPYRISL